MMSSDRSRDQTPGRHPPAGPARPSRKLPDEHALLHELWRISHFGWIAHATMLRSLTISAGHQIADAAATASRSRSGVGIGTIRFVCQLAPILAIATAT